MENSVNENAVQENAEESRLSELEKREKALGVRELKLFVQEELSRRGLGRGALSLVNLTDRDDCVRQLDAAQKLIRDEAAASWKKRFQSTRFPAARPAWTRTSSATGSTTFSRSAGKAESLPERLNQKGGPNHGEHFHYPEDHRVL